MPYVGRSTDKISNVEVLDNITFDGSSSYTLQKGGSNFTPSSANTLLVSIDGVVQAGNFTVSGSTIDFGTAVAGTSTCDFILHYGVGLITSVSDGTVTTAKLADSSVSLAKLTATGTKDATTFLRGDNTFDTPPLGGITVAGMFRLTTSLTGDQNPISSNIEEVDTQNYTRIGSAITESSGVFTFPSTGIYLIQAQGAFKTVSGQSSTYHTLQIQTTTDNSTFSTASWGWEGAIDSQEYAGTFVQHIFDVTDTSTHKIRFVVDTNASGSFTLGATTETYTGFSFIRLGDT